MARFRREPGLCLRKDAVTTSFAKRFDVPLPPPDAVAGSGAAPSAQRTLQLLQLLFNRASDGSGGGACAADAAPFVCFRGSGASRPYFLPLARLRDLEAWAGVPEHEHEEDGGAAEEEDVDE